MRQAGVAGEKYLGGLCRRGHDHEGTGRSLRKRSDRSCVVCCRERALATYYRDPVRYRSLRDRDKQRAYQAALKRRQRAANPELAREKGKQRYQQDRLKIRLRNRLRKAFTQFSKFGKQMPSNEYADFMAIIRHLGPCPGPPDVWQIDHIKPLASFDFNDAAQVREAFRPENHQWLTAAENRRKHAKEC